MVLLSKEHGVNPSLEQCFVCMKDKGVVLFGRIKPDAAKALGLQGDDPEAPQKVCLDKEPCDECKQHMEMGVILISVDESKSEDMGNPWRSGGWVVVKDEFIERVVQPKELADSILKKRMAFVPDEAWDMLGLPRPQKET